MNAITAIIHAWLNATKKALRQDRPLLTAAISGRGPQTEAECAQEWREIVEKQAREEATLLKEDT